jgi:hypothetical protein
MLIKRSIYPKLLSHLKNEEITLLVGPRQAGKTTLMMALIDELKEKKQKYLYLNLDIEKDRYFFTSQGKLIEKIKIEIGNGRGFIFIDEIQRKEDAGLFLKGISDMKLPYKFIVTGSGSVELKEKIYESLAGRKRIFEIYPLTFYEFADYKTDYLYSKDLEAFLNIDPNTRKKLLEEYLMFGGYPKVVLGETAEDKRHSLEDIYRSFVEKDIQILLKIEKSESLTDLLKIIGSQNGRLINYTEISNTLNLSLPTVKNYLWYLEKTYILEKSIPFFKNVRKEITKSPIYYFCDLGLRNYLLNINDFDSILDKGFLFQNFVFNELRRVTSGKTVLRRFWRTKEGAEVDIVLDTLPNAIPIEVKYSEMKVKTTRSLTSFVKKFNAKKSYVITSDLKNLNLVI